MRVIEKEPNTEVKQEDAVDDNAMVEADVTEDVTKDEIKVESIDEVAVSPPEHPFKDELSQFKPHPWQLEEKVPEKYSSLEDTKFTMIDSQSLLEEMMLKLKEVKELAINWENCSFRSFHGMVCLLQISTRTEDFVIDSQLLKEELKVLNEVCTDSEILKVFHGCDLEWMQKHFGIFVVNMFDTKKASGELHEDAKMGSVLKRYCKVELNKEYQRADWTVRPLPDEMVKYAREESHYLLYIHDVFRNFLLKRGKGTTNVLEEVYAKCTTSCGVVWYPEKNAFHPDSYLYCFKKIEKKLNVQQLECFRLLYKWRYYVALENDESMVYTLPNKFMLKISKVLPKDAQGVIECCDPVPQLVQENLEDICNCVLQAIKNVPEVPEEPVNTEWVIYNDKPSQPQSAENLKKKKIKCKTCGRPGHHFRQCFTSRGGNRGGFNTNVRGGVWNRGRGVPYGANPFAAPSMRGGPGFRNIRGRGPRHMGPARMHPYAQPSPCPLITDGHYGWL